MNCPSALLQLHLAEYQSLMARGTTFLTLEPGIWVLVALLLSFLPSYWKVMPHYIVIWGALAGVQILVIVLQNTLHDHYVSVQYIDNCLLSKVASLVGTNQFWKYESFLAKHRPKSQPWYFELFPTIVLVAIVVATGLVRLLVYQHTISEWLFFSINIIISTVLIIISIRMMKVRKHLSV